MVVTEGLIQIRSKFVQPENASYLIVVRPSFKVSILKLEQPLNADRPMVCIVEGSISEFNPLELLSAFAGISVTPSGIVMLVSFVQPAKVFPPEVVQPFGKLMLLRFVQFSKA